VHADSTYFSGGEEVVIDFKSSGGTGVRQDSRRLLCGHFCDTVPNLFSVYRRGKRTTSRRHMKGRVG